MHNWKGEKGEGKAAEGGRSQDLHFLPTEIVIVRRHKCGAAKGVAAEPSLVPREVLKTRAGSMGIVSLAKLPTSTLRPRWN